MSSLYRSTFNEESKYSKYSPGSGYRIKLAKSRSSHSIGKIRLTDQFFN